MAEDGHCLPAVVGQLVFERLFLVASRAGPLSLPGCTIRSVRHPTGRRGIGDCCGARESDGPGAALVTVLGFDPRNFCAKPDWDCYIAVTARYGTEVLHSTGGVFFLSIPVLFLHPSTKAKATNEVRLWQRSAQPPLF